MPYVSVFADEAGTGGESSTNADDDCGTEIDHSCHSTTGDVSSTSDPFLPSSLVGNPVDLTSGNKYQQEIDYQHASSQLQLRRHYSSQNADFNFGYGQGWTSSYSAKIYAVPEIGYEILQGTGQRTNFYNKSSNADGAAIYRSDNPTMGYVLAENDKLYWHIPDGRKLTFSGSYLVRIDFTGPQFLTLFYVNGKLAELKDEAGRVLGFEYYSVNSGLTAYSDTEYFEHANHLSRVNLPSGESIIYQYDKQKNLTKVTYGDGSYRKFHYEDEGYRNHLTAITDRNGVRYSQWSYHEDGKAATSELSGGVGKVYIDYLPIAVAVVRKRVCSINTMMHCNFPEQITIRAKAFTIRTMIRADLSK